MSSNAFIVVLMGAILGGMWLIGQKLDRIADLLEAANTQRGIGVADIGRKLDGVAHYSKNIAGNVAPDATWDD